MPIQQYKLQNIMSLVEQSLTSTKDQFESIYLKLIDELELLTKEELNSFTKSSENPGHCYSITELIIDKFHQSLNNLPDSLSDVERLAKIIEHIVTLKEFDVNAKNPGKLQSVGERYGLVHLLVSNPITNKHLSDRRTHINFLEKILTLLSVKGADFNLLTRGHETALHVVVQRHLNPDNAKALIEILHDLGCGINIVNKLKQTIYDLVSKKELSAITFNSALTDFIKELGGITGSVASRDFEAVKHVLEYKKTADVSEADFRSMTLAHHAVYQNQLDELVKYCLEGIDLTKRDQDDKSAVDLMLQSEHALQFLTHPVIKATIQSQCSYDVIKQVLQKCPLIKEAESQAQASEVVTRDKVAFFDKLRSKKQHLQSDDAKSAAAKTWESNLISLCKNPKLMQATFTIYMKSKSANKTSILNVHTALIDEDPTALEHLKAYCDSYLKSNPDKSSIMPSESELVTSSIEILRLN